GGVVALERDPVVVLERAELDGLEPPEAEAEQDGLLQPLVDDDLPVDDLGHPGLAAVEKVDGLLHPFGPLGGEGPRFVAGVPGGGDLAGEVVGHAWLPPVGTVGRWAAAMRSKASSSRSSGSTRAMRTKAAPPSP